MILLKETSEEDIQDIYENINLKYVKKYCIDYENQWEQHKSWYKFLIYSNSYVLYTLKEKQSNKFLGYVKFELDGEECAIINIYLIQEIREKGYSYNIINLSLEELKYKNPKISLVLAYILEENIISIKTFKKTGFQYESIEEYKGIEHLLFIKLL